MRKKLLGAEHPGILNSMGNLAKTYQDQERWIEAEQLQVQVMDMRKKLLGAENPHTPNSMANLASIYRNKGMWNEAEKLELEIMNIKMRMGRK